MIFVILIEVEYMYTILGAPLRGE